MLFLMYIDKAASLVSPTCLCPSFRRSEDDSCLSTRARTINTSMWLLCYLTGK